MSITDFAAIVDKTINSIRADMDAYDERVAIRTEACNDGKTTTERALAALQAPDTPWGLHAVAKAWLRECAPYAGIFKRESA